MLQVGAAPVSCTRSNLCAQIVAEREFAAVTERGFAAAGALACGAQIAPRNALVPAAPPPQTDTEDPAGAAAPALQSASAEGWVQGQQERGDAGPQPTQAKRVGHGCQHMRAYGEGGRKEGVGLRGKCGGAA
eukprot:scaffold67654_cov20-Tisochrysis_lutea.AAC.1